MTSPKPIYRIKVRALTCAAWGIVLAAVLTLPLAGLLPDEAGARPAKKARHAAPEDRHAAPGFDSALIHAWRRRLRSQVGAGDDVLAQLGALGQDQVQRGTQPGHHDRRR